MDPETEYDDDEIDEKDFPPDEDFDEEEDYPNEDEEDED